MEGLWGIPWIGNTRICPVSSLAIQGAGATLGVRIRIVRWAPSGGPYLGTDLP